MNALPGTTTGDGPLDIGRLGSHYHLLRGVAAGFLFLAMSTLAVVWDWNPGLYVALVVLVVGLHAAWRFRHPGKIVEVLLIDSTAVIVIVGAVAPPTEVGLAPVVVLATSAALLLGDRRAVWLSAYAAAGTALALSWSRSVSDLDWTTTETMILVGISVLAVLPLMLWLLKQTADALTERHSLEDSLRERESHYRLIAEGVSDAIVTTDEDGTIMYANPALERTFGHRPEDLVGKNVSVLAPEQRRAAHLKTLAEYKEATNVARDGMELIGLHRDGRELTLEVSFGEFTSIEGRRFIGTVRDVTDRYAAEAALRDSEARYRGLFEGVPVGVYRTSITGEILDANPTLIELLGYTDPADVIGRPAQDFYVDPSDREVWRHHIEEEEFLAGHEIQLKRPDGTTIWLRDSARELRDESGEIVGYEGTLEDVTVRRLAEERLQAMVETQRHRLLYEKALSACSHALLVGTDDQALEAALEALLEATGVGSVFVERNEEDRDLGLVTGLIYELNCDRRPADYERWGRVPWSKMPQAYFHLSRNEPFAFGVGELRGSEKEVYEGTPTKSELNIPIFVGGEWVGLVGFADFERERPWRDEEVSLLRTTAQMIGAFWERQMAHQKLQELVDYKDEFVASVSHELRTPLTAVVGLSEELVNVPAEGFTPAELAEFHQLIAQQSREVAYIVEDLLVAARVEIDTVTIDTQPVDFDAEVEATIQGWPSEFGTIEHVPGDVKVDADPARVRQIIRNLLTNAIRYGGSKVTAVIRTDGTIGILEVRDDGSGIDQGHIERIFQPYERVSESEVARPGSVGLGLYVSRQLANLMGGDLTCRRDGGETVFELSLPAL
ncbi:MAG TPA: PAS domain S-box protein [Acidimicrobiia bacterium]|nr:PAS domain S-box protein [Acidimicrobiia bacterium]